MINVYQTKSLGKFEEINLFQEDLRTLKPRKWVSDNIIYGFLKWCKKNLNMEAIILSPTFFFSLLHDDDVLLNENILGAEYFEKMK